jgi:hypothetical protein
MPAVGALPSPDGARYDTGLGAWLLNDDSRLFVDQYGSLSREELRRARVGPQFAPKVLLLGSRSDISLDLLVLSLLNVGLSYVRINIEDMPSWRCELDPIARSLTVVQPETQDRVSFDGLSWIYNRRAATRLRRPRSGESRVDSFLSEQWVHFERCLSVLPRCQWCNPYAGTLRAENKAVQLAEAHDLGLRVPRTRIGNDRAGIFEADRQAVLKGLGPVEVLFEDGDLVGAAEIVPISSESLVGLREAPAIVQELIEPKTDLRVTVVGEDVLAISIRTEAGCIDGNWKICEGRLRYEVHELPDEIVVKVGRLLDRFDLRYAALDFALVDDCYWFLEINPDGEWSWVEFGAGLKISEAFSRMFLARAV